MDLLKIAGTEIECSINGDGRPLLFLHGEDYFGQHRPFLDALAADWKVIVPRHPGFGASPLPGHFMKIDDLAYLYLDLMDAMKLDRPVIVGASFGAWIALELAVRAPERIDKLVLLGPVGVKLGGRYDRDFADIFQIPDAEVRNLTFADQRWVPDYASLAEAELAVMAQDRQSATHFGWRPYMHNPTLRHWLHRVRVATLIMQGDKDGVLAPGYAKKLVEALPKATLDTIANAGHYPQIEQSAAVVERIKKFAA